MKQEEVVDGRAGVAQGAGELVEPDRELFTITDLATVWVLADVYEKDLGRIAPGTDVTLRVGAYPERTFRGRLTYIGDAIDPQSRTYEVRVPLQAAAPLKAGAFVRAEIDPVPIAHSLLIDREAVLTRDGRNYVFRIRDDRFVGYWCLTNVAGLMRQLTEEPAVEAVTATT